MAQAYMGIDFAGKTDSLADWVANKKPLPAKLDPSLPIKGARKDKKWELIINTDVKSDL